MAFDTNAFDMASFTQPTKKISVPELKGFFEEDETPEFEIRGLTGRELAIVNEAVDTLNKTKIIIEAIAKGSNNALKDGMAAFLNKNNDVTPEDLARRFKMLEFGTIPHLPEHVCVKLAHNKPTTFYRITNEIIRMTGNGADLGK